MCPVIQGHRPFEMFGNDTAIHDQVGPDVQDGLAVDGLYPLHRPATLRSRSRDEGDDIIPLIIRQGTHQFGLWIAVPEHPADVIDVVVEHDAVRYDRVLDRVHGFGVDGILQTDVDGDATVEASVQILRFHIGEG